MTMQLDVIAKIRTDFPEKFGIPRQSGLVPELVGKIVFEPKYRNSDALRGLEGFSHLWVIWGFSLGFASSSDDRKWSPTVRPPRLGGNTRIGVFATRSPNRPNPIGLSCVKILSIEETEDSGTVIIVSGIDMADLTPIYDIKPYLPHADCIADASGGFSVDVLGKKLDIVISDEVKSSMSEEKINALKKLLEDDPRPSYQDDGRIYGLTFAGFDVQFKVEEKVLSVISIKKV
ncbi:MAG: tRNA (N6-threonylcarbamoyladenosine(37)-N6)-methyltransferase TrmO [Ruminococcaceae bacterium]|nr:tRNA (N6-threonylcarbamoyladenosine(37)-N6)-methyltransferase TrmO [Oscillospiraceae bacterium]